MQIVKCPCGNIVKNLVTAVINTPLTDLICGEKYNATRKIMSDNGIRCMYLMETA